MFWYLAMAIASQASENASPAERKGMAAIVEWRQCASDATGKLIRSTEPAETLAEVVLSRCSDYESNVEAAWFPLYAGIDIRNARADTDEAVQRIRSQLRGSILSQIVEARISKP